MQRARCGDALAGQEHRCEQRAIEDARLARGALERRQLAREPGVGGHRDAPQAGGDWLAPLRRVERRERRRAVGPASVRPAEAVRAVVDHDSPLRLGDGREGIHVGRQAEGVLREHDPRPRAQRRGHGGRIGGVRCLVDIDIDRRGAGVEDRVGHRDTREGRHDHLVAGSDAQRPQDRVEGHATLPEQRDVVGRHADQLGHRAAQLGMSGHRRRPSRISASSPASWPYSWWRST
jgi:hypothetical protein